MDLTSVFIGRVFNKNSNDAGRKLPRITSDDTPFKTNSDYTNLVNYYKGMEEDDEDKSYNWRDEYVKNRSQTSFKNSMSLYDDTDTSRKLKELFDESETLTIEDEIALMRSYHPGETYVDRNSNQITIITRTDNHVDVALNKHLGKYKNNSIKYNRVEFLYKMKFNPGIITEIDEHQRKHG